MSIIIIVELQDVKKQQKIKDDTEKVASNNDWKERDLQNITLFLQ
jgi:hypothetical protein